MVLCSSEPAPPKSLYAVNATHSSVTLLWTEEGVVDYYQVLCKPNKARKELKVREDVVSVSSAVGSERVQSVPQLQIRKRNREKDVSALRTVMNVHSEDVQRQQARLRF